ncbi:putative AAA+ superfamily ATPase, partial [Desulfomicrobium macestii]|nr:putative AAA+ superfamily ATPase [Desulfomicrobium macestii]
MPNSRLSMRKIKDVLRLHFDRDLSARQIGLSLKISHNTVSEYLRRAQVANLSWPLPPSLSDSELENLLFPSLPPSSVKR